MTKQDVTGIVNEVMKLRLVDHPNLLKMESKKDKTSSGHSLIIGMEKEGDQVSAKLDF